MAEYAGAETCDIAHAVAWVAADWGTSCLRVWAISSAGAVLAARATGQGMSVLSPEDFEPALEASLEGWLLPGRTLPILACGMVGSRQGWVEAPYLDLPSPPLVPGRLVVAPVRSGRFAVRIMPGLRQFVPPDVLRGEETQVAGLLAAEPDFEGVVCMPGTHSKWLRLRGGRIEAFRTCLTGEMFALLAERSVLRHSVGQSEGVAQASWDAPAFAAAVAEMLSDPGALMARLFSVRAEGLVAGQVPEAARARLSGLLIGAELAAMRDWWQGNSTVSVIAAQPLGAAYGTALSLAGVTAKLHDGAAMTLAGLAAARAATGDETL